jgi:predicted DNA-binding transcriptional regulator YafY
MGESPDLPRHLPIHRFKSAAWNGKKIEKPKNFKIDEFIENQNIGYLISSKPLKLEAVFKSMAGFHLTETPISKNQDLKQLKDGSYRLRATLPNTSQLRWWLLGFGQGVEVIKPKSLRDEFREISKNLADIYKK